MAELERDLRALAGDLALPEAPDLASRVGGRLRTEHAPRAGLFARRRLLVALALVLVAAAAGLAVPPVRAALLDVLEFAGVRVERVDELPETHPNAALVPGDPVPFAEAQRAVSFRILAPATKNGCRRCGTVYLDRTVPGGRVTFVWPGERPRLLLMEFRGQTAPYITKSAGPDTRIVEVDVAGAPGYWLAGAKHAVVFRDARGRVLFGRRLADNVLLWERGGVAFRLEGDIPLRQALGIARGVR